MCGRYNFSAEESEDIRNIIQEVERKQGVTGFKTGEIFPTNQVPILVNKNGIASPALFSWGFPGYKGKGVIINARSETAAEKPMFRKSLMERRCVIPSSGFYEWSPDKTKYRFVLPRSDTLYMAGVYNEFAGEPRFVILTTAANESIKDVHNRMPVILFGDEIDRWIEMDQAASNILSRVPPELKRVQVS